MMTGSDPKNVAWSYHNGGNWPVLIWPFVGAAVRTGHTRMAERTIELMSERIEVDKWPDPPVPEAPLLQVARNGSFQFSFPVKSGQSYQLRNTTDFSSFQNDSRPFSMNGDVWSFEVTQDDIDTGTFFDILVTVD